MDISSTRAARVRLGVQLWSQHATWSEVVTAAQTVERLGFDSLWTWDHFYPHVGAFTGSNFEAWTLMAALAALTHRVQLGVLVSAATYRHPSLVAYQTATLDHVSGGRAALGLGAGWFEYEHARLGFPFGTTRERLDRLAEAAAIIRPLLRGAQVDFAGAYYQLKSATLETKPLQSDLPLVLGGGGERRTLDIVARYADIWNFYGTVEVLRRKSAILDEHCERIGRDPRDIKRAVCLPIIIRSDAQAVEQRLRAVSTRNQVPHAELEREAGVPLAGNAQQVAEHINRYLDIGFSEVILMGSAPYDLETFERLAGEVAPLLKRAATRNA